MYKKGFTLIEIVVVLGIISIIGGLGLYYGFEGFRSNTFHSNRDLLVSSLQHARSQAISNICYGSCTDGKSHGVKILSNKLVVFQGDNFTNRDQDYDLEFEINPNTIFTGLSEIVFKQLSGDATNNGDIILTDNTGKTSTLSINSEGQIIWTN